MTETDKETGSCLSVRNCVIKTNTKGIWSYVQLWRNVAQEGETPAFVHTGGRTDGRTTASVLLLLQWGRSQRRPILLSPLRTDFRAAERRWPAARRLRRGRESAHVTRRRAPPRRPCRFEATHFFADRPKSKMRRKRKKKKRKKATVLRGFRVAAPR